MLDPTAFTVLQVIAAWRQGKKGEIRYEGCVHYVGSNAFGGRLQRWGTYSANKRGEVRTLPEASGCYDSYFIPKYGWTHIDATADVKAALSQEGR